MSRLARHFFRLLALLVCVAFAPTVDARALVVISEANAMYYRFVSALGDALVVPGGINVRTALQQSRMAQLGDFEVLVVVGVRAAKAVAKYQKTPPRVLYAMIPQRSYAWLERHAQLLSPPQLQVLYLNQPPQRYLHLCQALLVAGSTVGIVYSELSKKLALAISRLAEATSLRVTLEAVAEGEKMIPHVKAVLRRSDALLVLPDAKIYNERTIKAVLLNAFRADKPLLSYSASLTRSGGLAAVVVGPEEMGRQAGEILTCMLAKCDTVAVEQHWPHYFNVIVNRAIAKRIGIGVPAEADLLDQIKKMEQMVGDE